jgi:quinol-cytochrome oxidoreductase complex cytochrome b subunit
MQPRKLMTMRWWQMTAVMLAMFAVCANTVYALIDPLSPAARAWHPLGSVGVWALFVQIVAAAFLPWQLVSPDWRRSHHAWVPWFVLSICTLLRSFGTALTSLDNSAQWVLYLILAGAFLLGAMASARTY